ncbi:MAG TPA: hypothetical protein VIQ81_13155 [Gammaproteobacteria bacterium]
MNIAACLYAASGLKSSVPAPEKTPAYNNLANNTRDVFYDLLSLKNKRLHHYPNGLKSASTTNNMLFIASSATDCQAFFQA